MAIDVDEAGFEQAVIERSRSVPVLVDFWAEWCGPCHMLAPVIERAVDATDGAVELVKIDIDANPNIARRYGIQGIPNVKAFRDGELVDEFTGAQPPAVVERFVEGLLPKASDALLAAGDEQSLREAIELDPARADVRVQLARILLADGREAEALELLRPVRARPRGRRPAGAQRARRAIRSAPAWRGSGSRRSRAASTRRACAPCSRPSRRRAETHAIASGAR